MYLSLCFKKINYVFVFTVIFIVGCSESLVDEQVNNTNMKTNLEQATGDVMVIAHRACWRLAPENSLKAIEECIRIGVDMVELDVRRTKDGHLVIMHDYMVDRTTNGTGLVAEMTLAQLQQLNLREGKGGDTAITTSRIPTLEKALSISKGRILVNIDAKGKVRDGAYLIAKKLAMSDQVIIKMKLTSPVDAGLEENSFFNNSYFMPIIDEKSGVLKAQVANFSQVNSIAFEIIYITEKQLKEACQQASSQNARCWVNTLWESLSPGHSDEVSIMDPDKHWGHLIKLGVNMVQTDRPEELLQYLSTKKPS
jgi:glycerophosphoryl diester phosphodiesterase